MMIELSSLDSLDITQKNKTEMLELHLRLNHHNRIDFQLYLEQDEDNNRITSQVACNPMEPPGKDEINVRT